MTQNFLDIGESILFSSINTLQHNFRECIITNVALKFILEFCKCSIRIHIKICEWSIKILIRIWIALHLYISCDWQVFLAYLLLNSFLWIRIRIIMNFLNFFCLTTYYILYIIYNIVRIIYDILHITYWIQIQWISIVLKYNYNVIFKNKKLLFIP